MPLLPCSTVVDSRLIRYLAYTEPGVLDHPSSTSQAGCTLMFLVEFAISLDTPVQLFKTKGAYSKMYKDDKPSPRQPRIYSGNHIQRPKTRSCANGRNGSQQTAKSRRVELHERMILIFRRVPCSLSSSILRFQHCLS
jgi:hypothetical protein